MRSMMGVYQLLGGRHIQEGDQISCDSVGSLARDLAKLRSLLQELEHAVISDELGEYVTADALSLTMGISASRLSQAVTIVS